MAILFDVPAYSMSCSVCLRALCVRVREHALAVAGAWTDSDSVACCRSFRDEGRCETKYGAFWKEYREKVPYRLIPFVF